jgi:hypothetical protein
MFLSFGVQIPWEIPSCGHLACKECLVRWLSSHSTCHICKQAASAAEARLSAFASNKIAALSLRCPNAALGCEKKLTLGKEGIRLTEHLAGECGFQLVHCEDCKDTAIPRRDIAAHKASKCPQRIVTCPTCEERMRADVYESKHRNTQQQPHMVDRLGMGAAAAAASSAGPGYYAKPAGLTGAAAAFGAGALGGGGGSGAVAAGGAAAAAGAAEWTPCAGMTVCPHGEHSHA